MKIKDIMSHNVITISSNTSIADAKRIMAAHKIRRLPVADKGKLVGLVTERGLEKVSPSKATSLTVWELSYLLEKTPVKEIMEKEVITVDPEMDAEEAIALAQSRKVGSLIVIENGHIVGIVTTNDFFYNIINPLLGIGIPGSRFEIKGASDGKSLEEVIHTINKYNMRIISIHIEYNSDKPIKDVCYHVDSNDITQLINELKSKGYEVTVRKR